MMTKDQIEAAVASQLASEGEAKAAVMKGAQRIIEVQQVLLADEKIKADARSALYGAMAKMPLISFLPGEAMVELAVLLYARGFVLAENAVDAAALASLFEEAEEGSE